MSGNDPKKPSKGLFSQFSTPPKGTASEFRSTIERKEKARRDKELADKQKKELDERKRRERLRKEREAAKLAEQKKAEKESKKSLLTQHHSIKTYKKPPGEKVRVTQSVPKQSTYLSGTKSPPLDNKSTQYPSVSKETADVKSDLLQLETFQAPESAQESTEQVFETVRSAPVSPSLSRLAETNFLLQSSSLFTAASIAQIPPSSAVLSTHNLVYGPGLAARIKVEANVANHLQTDKLDERLLSHKLQAVAQIGSQVQLLESQAIKGSPTASLESKAAAVQPTPIAAAARKREDRRKVRVDTPTRRAKMAANAKTTAYTSLLEFKSQQANDQKTAARGIMTGPKPYNISKLKSVIANYKQIAADIRKTGDCLLLHCLENDIGSADNAKETRRNFEQADEVFQEQVETFKQRNEPDFGEKKRAKLPDLPFDSFAGDVLKYPSFKQTWDSMFGNRHDLEDVEKLRYLIKNMKHGSEAHRALENLPVVHDSYKQALETLESRFGKKDVVIACFQKQMESLPVARNVAAELRRTYDLLKHCFKTLQEYEAQPTDPFIINRWLEKFPPETIRAWIKHKTTLDPITPLAFLQWLETFVQSEETIALTKQISNLGTKDNSASNSKPSTGQKKEKDQGKKDKASQEADVHEQIFATGVKRTDKNNNKHEKNNVDKRKEKSCINCQSTQHTAIDCPSYKKLSVEQRWNVAKDKKACFICLIPGHRTRQCYRKRSCPKCKSFHCELLHSEKKPAGK